MDTKKHSHLPVFIILAVVFVSFIILASYLAHKEYVDESAIKVGLKWTHNAQFAGFYVAQTQSFYKDEGLEVVLVEPTADKRSGIDTVLEGKNDFVIVSPLEVLDYIAKDKPITAIAAIYQQSPTVIVSLPESGIIEPKDLRNKVLGTTRAENFSFSLYKFLVAKYKVPANSLDYKTIGFNALDELLSKRVDAVSMYRTQVFLPEGYPEQNFNYIKPEDHGVHMYNDVIVTSNKILEEDPEMVKKFLSATIKGWETALDYPEQGLEATMEFSKGESEYEKSVLNSSASLIRPDDIRNIGQMKASRWLEMYHLYKTTVISPEFDVSKGYTIDYLP